MSKRSAAREAAITKAAEDRAAQVIARAEKAAGDVVAEVLAEVRDLAAQASSRHDTALDMSAAQHQLVTVQLQRQHEELLNAVKAGQAATPVPPAPADDPVAAEADPAGERAAGKPGKAAKGTGP